MFDDQELVVEFVNESREHLAQIESQLLGIEQAGGGADLGLVNEVFRSVHSIKGAAGFMGFTTLGKLAHELENVLNLMRNGQLAASSPIIDTLLKAADRLRWLIDHVERSNEADISDHLAALEQIVAGLVESESLPAEAGAEPPVDVIAPVPAPATAARRFGPRARAGAGNCPHPLHLSHPAGYGRRARGASCGSQHEAASCQSRGRHQHSRRRGSARQADDAGRGAGPITQPTAADAGLEGPGQVRGRVGPRRPGDHRPARDGDAGPHAGGRHGLQPLPARRSRPQRSWASSAS